MHSTLYYIENMLLHQLNPWQAFVCEKTQNVYFWQMTRDQILYLMVYQKLNDPTLPPPPKRAKSDLLLCTGRIRFFASWWINTDHIQHIREFSVNSFLSSRRVYCKHYSTFFKTHFKRINIWPPTLGLEFSLIICTVCLLAKNY